MKQELILELIQMAMSGECQSPAKSNLNSLHVGEYVLIRTYSAGVHFGKLIERDGKEVLLDEARRIWSWRGAFTLSKVANCGISEGKLSAKVNGLLLTESIEIIPLSSEAKDNLYEISDHK